MAQALAYTKAGTKQDKGVMLNDAVFSATPNHELLKVAYTMYLANSRAGGAKTLTRGEVRGGGKKPWKQKGTGRARAGSSRLPHWTGGGVAFGPTGNENFTKSLPVKAKRAAIRQALSLQATDNKIMVIEDFISTDGKVKTSAALLQKLGVAGRVVIVVDTKDNMLDRATRNLPGVTVVTATYLNVFDIMNADAIIMTEKAVDAVSAWLGEEVAAPVAKPAAKPKAKKTDEEVTA